MAYSVNWVTRNIWIPRSDLIHLSGSQYRLNTADFHKEIRRLEWALGEGLWAAQIIEYKAAHTLAGTPFAPEIEIINGFTLTFEEFAAVYSVEIDGANTNVDDVTVINNVSIRSKNTGGLVGTREITEIHGRLGLDPDNPLVTNSLSITFGGVSMVLSETDGEVTVTRQ